MSKFKEQFGDLVLKLLSIVVLVSNTIFAGGLVFYKYYQWFIASVYTVPEITYFQAVGIAILLKLLNNHPHLYFKDEYLKEPVQRDIVSFVSPWAMLLIGWVTWVIIR